MLLNLEVNITAGSLTSCPGRFVWTPASHLLVRPEYGGRRRAVDALDGHFRGDGGAGAAVLRRRLGDGIYRCTTARWFGAAATARRRCSSAALLPRAAAAPLTLLLQAHAQMV